MHRFLIATLVGLWAGDGLFAQSTPTIESLAGTGNIGTAGDGGQATLADLGQPWGIAVDQEGNVYFSDYSDELSFGHSRVRRVDTETGVITTVAGGGSLMYPNDGQLAVDVAIDSYIVATDSVGNLYFDDYTTSGDVLIRRVDATSGVISTVAGGGAVTATISYPIVPPTLVFSSFDWPAPWAIGDGGPASMAYVMSVGDIAFDSNDNMCFSDPFLHRVRRIDASSGVITTIAGTGLVEFMYNGQARYFAPEGMDGGWISGVYSGDGGFAIDAGLEEPWGITVARNGDIYLADRGDYYDSITSFGNPPALNYLFTYQTHSRIRKIEADTGVITTVAGGAYSGYSGDGGPAASAELGQPLFGLALDALENLFICDYGNSVIRRVDAVTGVIETITGNGTGGFDGDGGLASSALLNGPSDIAFDSAGSLYISDSNNSRVRKVSGLSNSPPTANSGPDQSIHAGSLVTLDGSASFDDNTPTEELGYAWTMVAAPAGSSATLSALGVVAPSFTADLPGSYQVALMVSDGGGLFSAVDFVDISSTNLPPTANAGLDLGAIVGDPEPVLLDGTQSSDPELDLLTYSWNLVGAPAGSTASLTGADTATPSFSPDVEGGYLFELVVSDGFTSSEVDSVVVNAVTPAQFAETVVVDVIAAVVALPPTSVASSGNQKALNNLLNGAAQELAAEDTARAIRDLERAIERSDGCALRGSPDRSGPSRDWVTDCDAQAELYGQLMAALEALRN